MNRKRSHWLAMGLLLTTATTSLVLAAMTMAGFADAAAGDVSVSEATSSAAWLATVLVGSLVLIGLELLHSSSRRTARRGRLVRASEARA